MLSRKIFIFPILLILIITGSVLWINSASENRLSDSKRDYTIKKVLGRNLRNEKPKGSKWIVYANNYFTIQHPSDAAIYNEKKKTGQNDSTTLNLFSFDLTDPRITFASGVYDVENNSQLEEIPSVKFRKSQNNLYKESMLEISGTEGLYFNKEKDGVEKTLFIIKNNRLYSFSLSAMTPSKEIDRIFEKLIFSIKIF